MPTQATQHLIAAARNPSSSEADLGAAARSLFDALTCRADANAALADLAQHIADDSVPHAAFLALACGAMVEKGCDPTPLSQPLTARLRPLLEASARLADACCARMPPVQDEDEDEAEDPADLFEATRKQLAPVYPAENAAWEALEQFWRPAIALLSASPSARAQVRGLRDPAARIADFHQAGHWLQLIFGVLHDEPYLAIEPHTRLGIFGRMSGVVENFQLHVLLMDVFPHPKRPARRRVPKRIAEVARGQGPQETDETVTGCWNLYTWNAIDETLSLPDPADYAAHDCWIWGEGSPEDIPVFEGRRVILLGPPSYSRNWNCQRMFDTLPATLEVERSLTKNEVVDWLQRMAAAKAAS